MFVQPPYICTPSYIHTPPRDVHTPICPHTALCIFMFSVVSACYGGCMQPLTCWIPPPVWGCLPFRLHPHSFIGFPVHHYVLGISACDMGNISLVLWVWGCSPICWGFWGLYILVDHYVSHFYYGYDYYYSSYGGVFLAVICFISDCGSFPDGAFCNIGSV